jgi:hypothetical protein
MIVSQALSLGLDRAMRCVDLSSVESNDLLILWGGLFFTPHVLPHLPPSADVALVDCAQSGIMEAARLPPRGSRAAFCTIVFCYAVDSPNCPLSLVVGGRVGSARTSSSLCFVSDCT